MISVNISRVLHDSGIMDEVILIPVSRRAQTVRVGAVTVGAMTHRKYHKIILELSNMLMPH